MRNRVGRPSYLQTVGILVGAFAIISSVTPLHSQSEATVTSGGSTSRHIAWLSLPDAPEDIKASPDGPAAEAAQPPAERLLSSAPASSSTAAASATAAGAAGITASATLPEASRHDRYPRPGQPAPILTARDKNWLALHGAFSPFAATGWLFAAGYEQLTNTAPNWGTDRGAFGQRLGSAAIRATTEGYLSNGAMASLLHQDPRYYRLGRGHRAVSRVLYAATRPLVTRSDTGRTVPNLALMGGNLAGSALTNLYYPQQNHTVTQTFATFGSGLAGSAIGFGIAEFFGGILFDHNWHSTSH